MKKFLIPTDFTDNAWNATIYALKLFAEVECTFFFLHSTRIKMSSISNLSNKINRIMEDNAMIELKKVKQLAEDTDSNPNHEFDILLSNLNLKDAIDTAILTKDIKLVIMGTKGSTPVHGYFFGSNAVSIITKIEYCPVMVVPDNFKYKQIKQIALATDFKRTFKENEISILEVILELFDARVRILHITSEDRALSELQNYNKLQLNELISAYEHSFHHMPKYTSKTTEINEFIDDLQIDLLTLKLYKHNIIETLTKEPIIKKLGLDPHIPILIITE